MKTTGGCRPRPGPVARIRARCLEEGINLGELARRAGISRTTVYHLLEGTTRMPRASTLCRIARALQIDPKQLLPERSSATSPCSCDPKEQDHRSRQAFDRATNRAVAVACRNRPELFRDWSGADWEELYSSFGTGGELNEQGVYELAERMNRRRETVHKLQVVLETHLAEVAENLLETLYRMVTSHANLQATSELSALLAAHEREKQEDSTWPSER